MFSHVFTLALLMVAADVPGQPARATLNSEKLTILTVGDMTFTARTVQFQSGGESWACRLEGDAKMTLGDITITADRIQCNGNLEFESLVCNGNCTWQQDDGSGEVFSGDKLELQKDGFRITGNASLRFGVGDNITVITCDSIATKHGNEGYEFSDTVRLRHPK